MRITVPAADTVLDPDSVDLFDPALYATGDPHAVWHVLRARSPVHKQTLPDGRSFWSVTRYRDVNDVLRDHTRFTSSKGTLLSILGSPDPAGGKMMAASDPPVHTAIREPLMKVMSHRALIDRQPQIRRIVHRTLLGQLLDGGVWDVATAAADFPMAFTGTLMGLPERDWPRLTRLTTMAIAPTDSEFQEGSGHATLVAAHHELFDYFSRFVRRHRGGDDDLVGYLCAMDANGRKLRHDEIVYNCYSLLLGANVTTPHAIASSVLALIEHPAEYRRLLADPTLVATAVEEGLRWSSPANHFMRYAVRDLKLHGTQIRAGDALVTWLGSANRDEDVFADPYRFDVGRRPNRHVAFGFGPHYCIGAPLAKIALNLLFEEIVRIVEHFEIAGPVEHLESNFVAGIKRLPLTARLRDGGEELLRDAVQEGMSVR
ncbi:Steroid C26-monooxygenase [Streptomyces sp. RB5]|uniref:Steroid C26-monooxygenase n=1 Tax=Streptomyces smaragdinus TaxID=2585196 RepID=A0A7K0CH91_9ACTN|nr:cytochrome P450 [Streptomyces smaragdinus]MQY12851.1 Steroid C26-monooxygenase [Streptomyces smaragdinus]